MIVSRLGRFVSILFRSNNLINYPFILLFARFVARKRKNLRRFPKRWLRFSISYHSFIKRVTLKRNNRNDPTEEKIFFLPQCFSFLRSFHSSHTWPVETGKFLCGPFILRSLLFRIAPRRESCRRLGKKRRERERGLIMLFFNLNPVFLLLIKRVSKKILKFIKFLSNIPLKKERGGGKLDLCFNTFGIPTFLSKYLKREINF